MKNRYTDILKVLSKIVQTSEDKKEQNKARSLRPKLENFQFLLFLIIWESILLTMHEQSLDCIATKTNRFVGIHTSSKYDIWEKVKELLG